MTNNPKQQVVFIIFSSILAVFSLGSIITFTDPFGSSWITFLFFYLSLFIAVLGTFTIIGLGLRQWLWPKTYVINLSNSFRQGFLAAILVVVSFLLLANNLLYWWVEASLILFLLFVEAFLNLQI
ncbi:MAG: hypothetical protein M1383_03005 [Patescibacteria group bacterium]|nr:hypothetical protein [Patescibacteria group bacterium]